MVPEGFNLRAIQQVLSIMYVRNDDLVECNDCSTGDYVFARDDGVHAPEVFINAVRHIRKHHLGDFAYRDVLSPEPPTEAEVNEAIDSIKEAL